jgi:hypothetical protein
MTVILKSPVLWDIVPCRPMKVTSVLEENIASLFKVETRVKQATNTPLLGVCLMLHKFSVWKIDSACCTRKTAADCHTIQFHNPEDCSLYIKQIRQDKIKNAVC